MKVVYSETEAKHRPAFYFVQGKRVEARERPERAAILLKAVREAGYATVAPRSYGGACREAVHSRPYLAFLETAYDRWRQLSAPSDQILPSIHPVRHMETLPDHIIGQVGWFITDTPCPIGPGTWDAACASADTAIHAARLVLDGERVAYALCRPPGHHCFADLAGGFCYLNNVAIAAEDVRREADKVAIVDIDVHHGNGTQGIFYDRADVFFASVHGDPNVFYPFFAGYADETGSGRGAGCTFNRPLPLGSGDDAFVDAIQDIAAAVCAFEPDVVLVSLGLDAAVDDPFAAMAVTADGFRRAGETLGEIGLPLVLVQEGGYVSPSLGDNLVAVLRGVEAKLAG